jgi:hypothetical protein
MLAAQGNACKICGSPNSGERSLAVDHCHRTQRIRGLLCSACNTGLGSFRDSPELLKSAIKYLARE